MPADSNILFLAGAASGAAETFAVQPFDMIKTRHQLNTGTNESIASTFMQLLKEGGIQRLYRGITAELVGMVPKNSGMYASYEICRRFLLKDMKMEESAIVASMSGAVAAFPEAAIVTPSQVVKVRLQAKEHVGRFRGPVDCAVQTVRQEGLMTFLTTGLGPTVWRNSIWNSIYFGLTFYLKDKLPKAGGKMENSAQTFAASFFAASTATIFNAPFDVVKSRFQSQVAQPSSSMQQQEQQHARLMQKKYRSTLQALDVIYREEGLGACYKGFGPKVIRMGLGGAVAMTVFDFITQQFAE